MNEDTIKKYLQNYLDTIITPRVNKELPENESVKFDVYDILKGSYNPPIVHVFIDTDPQSFVVGGLTTSIKKHRVVESDIEDFFKLLGIENQIKVHWNKRPIFRRGKKRNEFTI